MQSPRHATEVGDSVHEGMSHRQGGKLDCLQVDDDYCDSGADMACGRVVDPTDVVSRRSVAKIVTIHVNLS